MNITNHVDLITFECLANPDLIEKNNTSSICKRKVSKTDRKFYRRRIIDATKKMLKNNFENETLKQLFNNYIYSLVCYFKEIDKTDILQGEYTDINNIPDIPLDVSNINENQSNNDNDSFKMNDKILFNPNLNADNKKITLDNFVKSTKQKVKISFPTQKEIDLSNPELKSKGITRKQKKENIDNL